MGNSLMLARDFNNPLPFDEKRLKDAIRSLDSFEYWREGEETASPENLLEAVYVEGDDSMYLHVAKNLYYMSFDRPHPCELSAALKIQQEYGDPIRALACDDPDFYVDLTTVSTIEELSGRL